MKFEKNFDGKMYKAVHVEWNSLYKGYGGETATKAAAMRKVRTLRDAGFSARTKRELHVKHPSRGPEVFYVIYARREGLTLDQVSTLGRKVLGSDK